MEEKQVQRLPVYFPGSARFQDANGAPSGKRGAIATVSVTINLLPQWLTGIRLKNVYPVPEIFQNANVVYLRELDGEQTVMTDLTQSNILVRDGLQSLMTGVAGYHWHPLPTPYPWGGGNNLTITVRRLTDYPDEVLPTVHVLLEGIILVRDIPRARNAAP